MVQLGLDSFLLRLTRRSDHANQPHEGVDLLRNSRTVWTEVLLQANSAKERDDQASEGIIIVMRSTRCSQIFDEQLMGFHYARDHDLAGFWGEVCELAHRVHREAALLPPTPITDLEKTLNIGPTQRLRFQMRKESDLGAEGWVAGTSKKQI
jgi:hypothetical protein